MKNYTLTIITIFITLNTFAQVQFNNVVVQNNGATIFISGVGTNTTNTVSSASSIHNNGKIIFNGNFIQTNTNDTLSNQALTDSVFISGDFDIENGIYDGADRNSNAYQGAIVMNGTSAQILNSALVNTNNIYNLVIDNSTLGANDIDVNGKVIVDNSIRFENGIVVTSPIDSLALKRDGFILGNPGIQSHVSGLFYREGNTTVSDLLFPIGNGGIYRPVTLKNVPVGSPVPIIGYELVNGTTGGTAGLGIDNIVDTRYWHGVVVSGDYQGAKLQLSYGVAEGIADTSQLTVAQSTTSNGIYNSLDKSGVIGNSSLGVVISEFNAYDSYYIIGESANMRVDLTAFLEGNYVTTNTMHDSLRANSVTNYLERRYVFDADSINPYGIEMLKEYTPPVGAVDVIMLTIRSPAQPAIDIDTTYAWLMTNGSIRDFAGGEVSYATFSNVSLISGADYTIVVWHRNHVPIMYLASGIPVDQSRSLPAYFDLSESTNVYGVGYKNISGIAAMYIGNADQNWSPLEVNALDLWIVGNEATNGMNTYYLNTDVDLDGTTNMTDWDKTKWANNQLYYSTIAQ